MHASTHETKANQKKLTINFNLLLHMFLQLHIFTLSVASKHETNQVTKS